ncbi:MAG TPA: chemotaxis protein CheW, partial [Anaeromyxobacteraceae bacterium]|nr:chemotaxis protein CheW [Anaeromyxobacteraceae bacterium]
MLGVDSRPGERKALLFSAGGARLALRLSQLREILPVPPDGELRVRDEVVPGAFAAVVLGLPPGPAPFAILTEGAPATALRVEAVHGIVDLAEAEVFQLPSRTPLPQPAPFAGAIVHRGEVALELAVSSLGWAPLEPALERSDPPPDLGPSVERELTFARGPRRFGVPLSILLGVLEGPRVAPLPLAPASYRGLLYHGRALFPVRDVAVLYGDAPVTAPRSVLLLDAGG